MELALINTSLRKGTGKKNSSGFKLHRIFLFILTGYVTIYKRSDYPQKNIQILNPAI